jgi:pimeloyl-ACP methyl ester carboxylesterase
MFEKQVEYFKQEYTVITWDVPLHGLSRPYSNFTYENCAHDLMRILDQENVGKVILVGMSMGGYPSQEFAFRYPEKVEGFIALDTTPFGLSYYSKSDIWWLKHVAPMAKCYSENTLRKSMAKSVSRTKYSYDKMIEMLAPLTKSQIIEQMDIAYGLFTKENKDVSFSFPVQILLGEFDKTGKVQQYCQAWSKKEGYPLHIIKKAAHFSNGDNPEQVNSEIHRFINGLSK